MFTIYWNIFCLFVRNSNSYAVFGLYCYIDRREPYTSQPTIYFIIIQTMSLKALQNQTQIDFIMKRFIIIIVIILLSMLIFLIFITLCIAFALTLLLFCLKLLHLFIIYILLLYVCMLPFQKSFTLVKLLYINIFVYPTSPFCY